VIDFEYASANTPGLEFANHFTEWCYNYHDPKSPESCNTSLYPSIAQQRVFIKSYLNHRPQFNPRASATPKLNAMEASRNSISDFYLDSRTPGGGGSQLDLGASAINYAKEEEERERTIERQVNELLNEARIWRVANSAQWVAWGIVQAKVEGLEALDPPIPEQAIATTELTEEPKTLNGEPNHADQEVKQGPEGPLPEDSPKEAENLDEEEAEFDYLAYAQDRALFFWGDVVGLGIVAREELPQSLVERLKIVDF
jgi:choline kinase